MIGTLAAITFWIALALFVVNRIMDGQYLILVTALVLIVLAYVRGRKGK